MLSFANFGASPSIAVARRRRSSTLALILCWMPMLPVAHCQQKDPIAPTPVSHLIPRPTDPASLPIGPGDLVEVQVFHTPELSAKYRVSTDGTIRLLGADEVKVDGLSPSQASGEIERDLAKSQIMIDPQVTVFVDERAAREVSILGEVTRPGVYTLQGYPSLGSALAAAGGVTVREGSTITITHRNDPIHPDTIRVDNKNPSGSEPFFPLQSSDVVLVSQAGLIYVVGDVVHPGEFYMTNGRPMRALEALALAQGLKDNALPEKASIIRTTPAGAETISVNLVGVEKNRFPDPVLEPSDVLVIPHSGLRQFSSVALPSLTGAAMSAVALALVTR